METELCSEFKYLAYWCHKGAGNITDDLSDLFHQVIEQFDHEVQLKCDFTSKHLIFLCKKTRLDELYNLRKTGYFEISTTNTDIKTKIERSIIKVTSVLIYQKSFLHFVKFE